MASRALSQQAAVGQSRERVVVRQPVDSLLVGLAVVDLAVQAVNGVAQLSGAVLHLALQLLVRSGQGGLGLLALGDVHGDPDRALGRVGRVDELGAHFADHGRAVAAAQLDLAFVVVPGHQVRVAAAAHVFPARIAGVPAARRAAQQLAALVAQHLLEVAVAACQVPVAQEDDAHHGVVEQELLLVLGSAQGCLGALLLVDVVQDPDGALGGVVRVDEPPREAAPERAAVASAQRALGAKGLPLAQRGVGQARQLARGVAAGVEGFGVQAHHLLGAGIAEDLGIALVATHDAAMAQEHDAHASAVEQGLLFTQDALQGGIGGDPRTLQFWGAARRRHENRYRQRA